MSSIDWIVLVATLLLIICYGIYKSKTEKNLDGYFRGNQSFSGLLVLLGIMGTQASAITFLSAPGQAFTDGMRFLQYYFGLPIAMVVIAAFFVPIFRRLNVYTAYEYIENRFDFKTRLLTSILFLLSRGLSTGISIYAPSIILSGLMGWNIYLTNIVMGGLLIVYTVSGGAKAVAHTQKLQLTIILSSLFVVGYFIVDLLPESVGFSDALHISGKLNKLNVITTGFEKGSFDWSDKYNIFSGLIGGFFLALSYFGTDQSQVGRFISAKTVKEARMGLLLNGLVKIPMQFFILLIGGLLVSFYLFFQSPVFYNESGFQLVKQNPKYADTLNYLESTFQQIKAEQKEVVSAASVDYVKLNELQTQSDTLRNRVKSIIKKSKSGVDANDTNYIFLRFVVDFLPKGLVGLMIAVIFLAAWGSIAAALNSLASSTVVDIIKPFSKNPKEAHKEYRQSKWITFFWGLFCIAVACFAYNLGNSLIEAVNILGSLFYGPILGIFLAAMLLKTVTAREVFPAALIAQLVVIALFLFTPLSFLWYNVAGCMAVLVISYLLGRSRVVF